MDPAKITNYYRRPRRLDRQPRNLDHRSPAVHQFNCLQLRMHLLEIDTEFFKLSGCHHELSAFNTFCKWDSIVDSILPLGVSTKHWALLIFLSDFKTAVPKLQSGFSVCILRHCSKSSGFRYIVTF